MLDTGQIIADRYELLKRLGRGGFSEVWLAQDKLTEVKVAIKIYAPGTGLDDAGISLFTQEFSLVFDMNHTNLLHPTHYDCWERMPYLILPFCKNGSAFKYLVGEELITETECWHLLHDVAEGLAYLHAKIPPVIHQDIKPDNILINDEGGFMITDFGISARVRSTLRRNQGEMSSGGTLAYMGPERFGPSPAPIMASDIWSLGATLYELMTGMPPYGEHGGVLQKNGADIPLIEANFSEALKDVIYKCLALNPWDRPTAKQIADYAYSYLNGDTSAFIDVQSAGGDTQTTVEPTPLSIEKSLHSSNDRIIGSHSALGGKEIVEGWISKLKSKQGKIGMIAGFGLILILALIWGLSGNEISEENPFTDSPQHKNDLIYAPLIERGKVFEELGDRFRTQIDTLYENGDSVFEDYYLRSLELYRQVSVVGDSLSDSVYFCVKDRIRAVESVLDSALHTLREKSDMMEEFGQDMAARVFEDRALKIETYINTNKRNENE